MTKRIMTCKIKENTCKQIILALKNLKFEAQLDVKPITNNKK